MPSVKNQADQVSGLLDEVLGHLWREFYVNRGLGPHEFHRDKHHLIRAISRYGVECHHRGWDLQIDFIRRDLLELLRKIKTNGTDIRYLPTYLNGAVTRHVHTRAEELSAEAKRTKLPKAVAKVVNSVGKVEAIREKSATEVLADVFTGLGKLQCARKAAFKSQISNVKSAAPPKQKALL